MNTTDTANYGTSTPDLPTPPGTPDYLAATATFNLAASLRPQAAFTATTAHDIQEAVKSAALAGSRVVPIVTGHSATMLPAIDDALLVRVDLDTPIVVDPVERTVTIPAGAHWGDVVDEAVKYGLAVPHGSSPDVGAIGYLLGGGLSFYGRTVGVAANCVVSISLVTADGELRTVDAENDPELFWALRGGGGGFGIVTSMVIRAFAMQAVLTGMTAWDAGDAREVARAWRTWTRDAPRSVTTALRLLRLPDIPETPEVLRGRQVLVLDGAIGIPETADAEDAYAQLVQLLGPMVAALEPLLETWHLAPASELPATHGDPRQPLPYATDCLTIGELSEEALDAWWEAAGPASGTGLAVAEFRQLGGAFADTPNDGGAFSRIDGDVVVFNLGVVPDLLTDAEVRADLASVRAALEPFSTRFTAPTLVEEPDFPRRTFPEDVEERVEAIRQHVDPAGMFDLDTRRSHR